MGNPSNDKNEVLLISCKRGYEEELIKGSLQSAKIPFYTKGHSGPAGFSRYDTKYATGDVEYYVPKELLKKAKEALPPMDATKKIHEELAKDEAAAEDSGEAKAETKTSKPAEKTEEKQPMSAVKRTWAMILFLIVAIGLIFSVDSIMNMIRSAMGWQ